MNFDEALMEEWIAKYRQFLLDFTSLFTLRRPRSRRVEGQRIREELIKSLRELYELASRYAKSQRVKIREKERWAKLSAYIAQTINTILKTHDELEVEEAIEELKNYVESHVQTQRA